MDIPKDLFTPRQLDFLSEGMTLSLQIIEGEVLWANMPAYANLEVTVCSFFFVFLNTSD
jgi:hypothetical protein